MWAADGRFVLCDDVAASHERIEALLWDTDGLVCRGVEACEGAAFEEFRELRPRGGGDTSHDPWPGPRARMERQRPPLVNLLMLGVHVRELGDLTCT